MLTNIEGYTITGKGDELDLNETLHKVVQDIVLGHIDILRDVKLQEACQNSIQTINNTLFNTLNEIERKQMCTRFTFYFTYKMQTVPNTMQWDSPIMLWQAYACVREGLKELAPLQGE